MLLQDNKERQVVLGQNPHTKEFTVAVYNKETGKKRVYKTKKMMHKLICECIWKKEVELRSESEVIIMFGICLLIFIGLCIYHACEKELPAGYHNNWRLEEHDAQLVREGKMTKRQFLKNMDNGKYR